MTGLPPIVTATIDYENWLSRQVDAGRAELDGSAELGGSPT
jgi:hypothetical protein